MTVAFIYLYIYLPSLLERGSERDDKTRYGGREEEKSRKDG